MADNEIVAEELAGTTVIDGSKIDSLTIKWKASAGKYPLPQSVTPTPETAEPVTAPNTDGMPASTPSEQTPTEPTPEQLADLEEVKAVKTMLANKVLTVELKGNSQLDVEARKKELMSLNLNDMTKLISESTPDTPEGEDYTTSMSLAAGTPEGPKDLRGLIALGLEKGVL